MKDETLVTISNIIWFSFWFYLIAFKGLSAWWFLFPVILHWEVHEKDEKRK